MKFLAGLLKNTVEVPRVTKAIVSVLGAVCLSPCSSEGAGNVVQFQTSGSSFSPAVYLNGTPQTFLWSWSDGTSSSQYPIATKNFGSSGTRNQYLAVDPI